MSCHRYTGRTSLITGAGSGIGRACAHRLAAEGASVIATDRDLAAAQAVVAELGPGDHRAVELDVTSPVAVEAVFGSLAGLDVLVGVAGGDTTDGGPFARSSEDDWHAMLELNLLGAVRCVQAALPLLRRSERCPAIVLISSINALAAFGGEPYSAAKAGLTSLVQNLTSRHGPEGIRANVVAPGTVRTPVWDGQPGGADAMAPLYPLGRVGEPADIAAAVAFLGSDDAAWITGHTLPVDGGFLAGRGIDALLG